MSETTTNQESRMTRTTAAIAAYAASIITANLLVAEYGPSVTIWNALFLIGMDLVLRDYLHDAWHDHRVRNMALLIIGTGVASYALNPATGRIAIASSVAFMLAAAADWSVYTSVERWPWLARSNASNAAGAAVDSIVFPTLAFGAFMWPIVLGQFLAKTVGAAAWSVLIDQLRTPRAAAHNN